MPTLELLSHSLVAWSAAAWAASKDPGLGLALTGSNASILGCWDWSWELRVARRDSTGGGAVVSSLSWTGVMATLMDFLIGLVTGAGLLFTPAPLLLLTLAMTRNEY